jgi:murein DD-endopeptidase MepM/ murein hydrolase activator NlpD
MKRLAICFVALAVAGAAFAQTGPKAPPVPPTPPASQIDCAGAFAQGGIVVCRTLPGARVYVDGVYRGDADGQGWFVAGFDRDGAAQAQIETRAGGSVATRTYPIAKRTFSVQRVDGLPSQTVNPSDPAVLAKIKRDQADKARGFSSRARASGWLDAFAWPVQGRMSGPWGNQRVLNGEPRPPHFGIDIAAPAGTAIRAPAGGVIALAKPDMHFEGGFVLLDHGQGLLSMYLHMSRLDVKDGDRIAQGQVLGAVGRTGRATGPHLCWRMKWRERNIDPSLAVQALSNARAHFGVGAPIATGAAPTGFTAWAPSANRP